MNTVTISLLASAIALPIITWYFMRLRHDQQIYVTELKIKEQAHMIFQLGVDIKELQSQKDNLLQRSAVAETKVNHAEQNLEEQRSALDQIGDQFRFEFKNLAQSIMEEKTVKLTEISEQKINDVLLPLRIQLGEFKKSVTETYDKESRERLTLGREVERLISMTQQVSQEANNLTSALKGSNKIQGNWGEMILESILESSGMAKDREYFLQEFLRDNAGNVIKDEKGRGLQPDAMIIYPDQRKIIIDSKVSLVAWDNCCAQSEIAEQQRLLGDHVKSIRQHIDGLGKKNYPRYALALDYLLLFIPIEPAFIEALKFDHSLWKYAYDKKILLVSPTNLFAVLRIVSDLWKVEKQNRHAIEIADKAGALYDKFAGFVENFELVGKRLTDAGSAFDSAHKQLLSGRGSVTNKIEELKKMGANTAKQLPERLL